LIEPCIYIIKPFLPKSEYFVQMYDARSKKIIQ
jgi:hypothetical protein